VWQVAFSPTGDQLATSGADGTARLWDLNGNEIAQFEGHQGPVLQVAFSPTGDQLATSGEDGTARLWDLAGNQVAEFEGSHGTLDNDWRYIAIADNDIVKLWPVYPLEHLDKLLVSACQRLIPFLTNNRDISDEDLTLCNVSPSQQN
ncbi:MAG: hypothetical protein AAF282_01155, partial [Cyanobacteria bacterium P01_A01_bin.15]